MNEEFNQTRRFSAEQKKHQRLREVLEEVYEALSEKKYNPIDQIVGYLISGDPAYITSHRNARALIRSFERDEILEELLEFYLKK